MRLPARIAARARSAETNFRPEIEGFSASRVAHIGSWHRPPDTLNEILDRDRQVEREHSSAIQFIHGSRFGCRSAVSLLRAPHAATRRWC